MSKSKLKQTPLATSYLTKKGKSINYTKYEFITEAAATMNSERVQQLTGFHLLCASPACCSCSELPHHSSRLVSASDQKTQRHQSPLLHGGAESVQPTVDHPSPLPHKDRPMYQQQHIPI